MQPLHTLRRSAALAALSVVTLAGCSSTSTAGSSATSSTSATEAPSTPTETVPAGTSSGSGSATGGRVALTYDGGIYVLDADTLKLEADIPLAGFNRLNPAGDSRHVLVSTATGFQVLDTAAGATVSGLSPAAEPALTDLVFPATTPGHVVRHAGKTVLFDDGTGNITTFDSDDLTNEVLPAVEVLPSENAHHGVAIELADGTVLSTLGNTETRSGIRVLDAAGDETARNEDCPSVHGEGAAADEAAVFGCSNGVLLYRDGQITKLTSPDQYGRIGNQYVTDTSPIAVGDYNSNPDSESYLLTELAFIDTGAKKLEVIDLPDGVSYTWRDVARGADDEVLLLSSDGSLYTYDPTTHRQTAAHPVIQAWEGPEEWQNAHPALTVLNGTAYITEPASKQIHAVNAVTGQVLASTTLDAAPIEIAVASGQAD